MAEVETLFGVGWAVGEDGDVVTLDFDGIFTVRLSPRSAADVATTLWNAAVKVHGNSGRDGDDLAGEAGGQGEQIGRAAEDAGVPVDSPAGQCACGGSGSCQCSSS